MRCGPVTRQMGPVCYVRNRFFGHTWGRGYATEAAAAAMDWAVDLLGSTDIIQTISPENIGSQRVASKLGAVNRGARRRAAG